MGADFEVGFGEYTYSDVAGCTISSLDEEVTVRMRIGMTPDRHGAYSTGGLLDGKHWSISGIMQGATPDELRAKMQDLLAAHMPGTIQEFYVHSDRYRWAEVSGITGLKYGELARIHVPFKVDFFAADPLTYDSTETVVTGLAAGGTVTPGGAVETFPVWTLVVGTAGGGTITVSDGTDSWILTPTLTGTYVLDARLEAVVRSSVDRRHEVSGTLFSLVPGANAITVVAAGGAVVTSLEVAFHKAYV